jgi:hypothetical protein
MIGLGVWTSGSAERVAQRAAEMFGLFDQFGLRGPLGQLLEETNDPSARPVHAYNRANWQMLLGRDEAALSELESGLGRASFDMIYIAQDPIFDRLRGNARFEAVMEKMGLTPKSRRE